MKTSEDKAELRSVPAAEARALLEAQKSSGMSIAAFARERGVHPWSLYNARGPARSRKKRNVEASFDEVHVVGEPASSPPTAAGNGIELCLHSGLSVRISDGFDEVTLRRVLGILATC